MESGLEIIEKYVKALELLNSEKLEDYCKSKNLYCKWIITYKELVINLLNNNKTNWFSNVKDKNRNSERNKMVGVWSLLNVLINYVDKAVDDNLILSIRIFYNRYFNYVRSVEKNIEESLLFSSLGYDKILNSIKDEEDESNNEELMKYSFILSIKEEFYKKLTLIWELEEHPTNLNGRDVGNTNSSHLIDYKENPTSKMIELTKDKFYELIPINEDGKEDWKNYHSMLNCLITYGKFWNTKVTNDYENLDFDNERRIIRDIDSVNDKYFYLFFKDYKNYTSLSDFVKEIIKEPKVSFESDDWLAAIQWYNYKLKEKMWTKGNYIAIGAKNYRTPDMHFKNIMKLVNTKGNFNGGEPQLLSDLIISKN